MKMSDTETIQRLYGKHPVREALRSDRPVYRLWLAQGLNPGMVREFEKLAKARQVPVQIVPHKKLDQMLPGKPHQGLIAETGSIDYADWDLWLKQVSRKSQPFVVVLDQIQDPHNLGAIVRTAEAAGVHGVVLTRHHSVGISEVVAKASAGAIETVPLVQVTNLAQALEALKAAGIWVMGLSVDQGQSHFQANLTGGLALVIGNEHKGIRPNIEKHCDVLLNIPAETPRSLNASVAAAVVMYEAVRQRQAARAK